MIAKHNTTNEPRSSTVDRGPGSRAHVRSYPCGASDIGADPFRRRAAGRSGRGHQKQAARPRDLDHRDAGRLSEAIKRKAFARGYKREVRLPLDFVARTERLLEQAVLDALAEPERPDWSQPGSSKPRRPWKPRTLSPWCTRSKPHLKGPASSMLRGAGSRAGRRW